MRHNIAPACQAGRDFLYTAIGPPVFRSWRIAEAATQIAHGVGKGRRCGPASRLRTMLRDDRRPHRIYGRSNAAKVKHGIEPPLAATLHRRRPRIGSDGLGMAL